MANNFNSKAIGMDTPWHIGYTKKEEDDPRRDKRRCIFLHRGKCQNGRSGAFTLQCPGSSHCKEYREEYHDEDFMQEERYEFEATLYHRLTKKQVWEMYSTSVKCPFCEYRWIRERDDKIVCPRCEFTIRKPEEKIPVSRVTPIEVIRAATKKNVEESKIKPQDMIYQDKKVKKKKSQRQSNTRQKVDTSCAFVDKGVCQLSLLKCHCEKKELCMFYNSTIH